MRLPPTELSFTLMDFSPDLVWLFVSRQSVKSGSVKSRVDSIVIKSPAGSQLHITLPIRHRKLRVNGYHYYSRFVTSWGQVKALIVCDHLRDLTCRVRNRGFPVHPWVRNYDAIMKSLQPEVWLALARSPAWAVACNLWVKVPGVTATGGDFSVQRPVKKSTVEPHLARELGGWTRSHKLNLR